MKNVLLTLSLAVLLLANTSMAQQLRAEPSSDVLIADVVLNHPLAKYIDESSVGVVELNVKSIDVDAAKAKLKELAGDDSPLGDMFGQVVNTLRTAGVESVFVLLSTQSVADQAPLIVIPHDDPLKLLPVAKGVFAVLQGRASEDAVLLSSERGLQRLAKTNLSGAEDELSPSHESRVRELLTPLSDAQRADHTAVLSLPPASKHLLGQLWPERLPDSSPIQLSPRKLAQDIDKIVVGLTLPPSLSLKVNVLAESEDAGSRLADQLDQITALDLVRPFRSMLTLERGEMSISIHLDGVALDMMKPLLAAGKGKRNQTQRSNDMKQIGLAFHNYADVNGHLPPRCFVDRDGKPLLSWRVPILPWLSQQAFYYELDLSRAWDDQPVEHLMTSVLPVYTNGSDDGTLTTYRAPVFPGSLWSGDGPPKQFRDVTDGTSNTIAVIDAPESAAVHWANPEPWVISAEEPIKDVFGERDEVRVLMLDGSVLTLERAEMTNEKLKAMLTIAGGDQI
ncbi:DUF1559 family PulG-like putative transporter [Stieleria varia]|uniref:DUF1559 domain-containing protein n=1 Tax=Stieleria varia TaxID=2528005 RepID=A0A5C6AXS7_9BACT|nr:DUF1559 domain-containing protein [Stieleria varia]TWU04438.1 hypothetical protein Pla52n_24790 [Stieleria varia]